MGSPWRRHPELVQAVWYPSCAWLMRPAVATVRLLRHSAPASVLLHPAYLWLTLHWPAGFSRHPLMYLDAPSYRNQLVLMTQSSLGCRQLRAVCAGVLDMDSPDEVCYFRLPSRVDQSADCCAVTPLARCRRREAWGCRCERGSSWAFPAASGVASRRCRSRGSHLNSKQRASVGRVVTQHSHTYTRCADSGMLGTKSVFATVA